MEQTCSLAAQEPRGVGEVGRMGNRGRGAQGSRDPATAHAGPPYISSQKAGGTFKGVKSNLSSNIALNSVSAGWKFRRLGTLL